MIASLNAKHGYEEYSLIVLMVLKQIRSKNIRKNVILI